jgi:DNA-directed RNA polymerase specialized sigma24 family protein
MARIEGIKLRLERWGRWSMRSEAGSLGWPRANLLARQGVRGGGAVLSVVDQDAEAAKTQEAVDSLRFRQPHLHRVLILHYVKGYELTRVAPMVGRALSTVKRNLEDADFQLRVWLVADAEKKREAWKA